MEKLYSFKAFLKKVGGRMLFLPPVSAPGHKLQKTSKESGIFQSHGIIIFVRFIKRQNHMEVVEGAWHSGFSSYPRVSRDGHLSTWPSGTAHR